MTVAKIELSNRPLRILHCVSSMDPKHGGVVQAIRSLVSHLGQLGCENHIVCLDQADSATAIDGDAVCFRIGPGQGAWSYSSRLQPWLHKNLCNYQFVIIHGLWQFHGFAVTRAVRKLKAKLPGKTPKVFVMPHGMLDPWFQTEPSRHIKAWRNWLIWKAVEHRTIGLADGLLFTCQSELELARQPFRPYQPAREVCIGLGVQPPPASSPDMLSAFQAACPGIGNRKYWLFLSRIHPKKGADILLHAYAKIAKHFSPSGHFPALVVAGPLDSDFAVQIQQLAADLQLTASNQCAATLKQPAAYFPGMLTGDAKWGAFYNCDAFVLPSHQENFGIAVAEALACGKPVLISDKVNIYGEIQNGQAGLVTADSFQGTCDLLLRWMDKNEQQKSQMSRNAATCYRTHFRAETAAQKLLANLTLSMEA